MTRRSRSSRSRSGRGSGEKLTAQQRAYADIAARDDFQELRRRYIRFAFPATAAFMVWYVTYIVCNNWARDFMAQKVVGTINVAVVFGLLQFISTFLIAYLYARHSAKSLDPLASSLHDEFESRVGGRR